MIQIRVVQRNAILLEGDYKAGETLWVNERRARELCDASIAVIVGTVGPSETKVVEAAEKK